MTKLKHYFWNLIDMKTSSNVFKMRKCRVT